jgi:hypothetical protein
MLRAEIIQAPRHGPHSEHGWKPLPNNGSQDVTVDTNVCW